MPTLRVRGMPDSAPTRMHVCSGRVPIRRWDTLTNRCVASNSPQVDSTRSVVQSSRRLDTIWYIPHIDSTRFVVQQCSAHVGSTGF